MSSRAEEQIKKILEEVRAKLSEAESLADDHGVPFSWDGPAYGMGGTYFPPQDSTPEGERPWYSSNEGWVSSSAMC